jgi:TolB-like protein
MNMSQDTEQETFVDGLAEYLITDLSRHSELFVIARHSTFAYKGKAADVRQIARDPGVRYLLEGSARRAAGRVRINAQLVDASSGEHLWAERSDRELEDIFLVQDEVIGRIVEALLGRLAAPPPRTRPTDLRAYDLRARALIRRSPEAEREATLLLQQAIALDPGYAEAHRWLAFNLWTTWVHCGGPIEPNRHQDVELAERAVALDWHDAGSHWAHGRSTPGSSAVHGGQPALHDKLLGRVTALQGRSNARPFYRGISQGRPAGVMVRGSRLAPGLARRLTI